MSEQQRVRIRYTPLISQICLISDKHYDNIVSSLCADIVNPLGSLLEGVSVLTG
jgi:hypothetical protein